MLYPADGVANIAVDPAYVAALLFIDEELIVHPEDEFPIYPALALIVPAKDADPSAAFMLTVDCPLPFYA